MNYNWMKQVNNLFTKSKMRIKEIGLRTKEAHAQDSRLKLYNRLAVDIPYNYWEYQFSTKTIQQSVDCTFQWKQGSAWASTMLTNLGFPGRLRRDTLPAS